MHITLCSDLGKEPSICSSLMMNKSWALLKIIIGSGSGDKKYIITDFDSCFLSKSYLFQKLVLIPSISLCKREDKWKKALREQWINFFLVQVKLP